MTERATRASGYILRFLLWSVVLAGAYYLIFPYYARAVLALAEVLVDHSFRDVGIVPFSIGPVSYGIAFSDSVAGKPVGLSFNLFLIFLNLVFAVALVLTTLGLNRKGLASALGAVVIMLGLHSVQITTVVYYYLTDPRNTLVPVDFAPWVMAAAPMVYNFFDKMADALFPFLTWIILCFDTLARALYGKGKEPAGEAAESP